MLVNDRNRESLIKSMVKHYSATKTEEEIRNEIANNPQILEGYAEWRANFINDRKECFER